MGARFEGAYDVDCAEAGGRWAATVRGAGLPASAGHSTPAELVFAALDLLAAHTGMRPAQLRLHPAGGRPIEAHFPPGRSEHRTSTEHGTDWSDTWTASPDADVPGVVCIAARRQSAPRRTTP